MKNNQYCSVCLGMDDKMSDCEHCSGTGYEPKSVAAKELGHLGGVATASKYGTKHFSEAGKKGNASRWAKKPIITTACKHGVILGVGNCKFGCA